MIAGYRCIIQIFSDNFSKKFEISCEIERKKLFWATWVSEASLNYNLVSYCYPADLGALDTHRDADVGLVERRRVVHAVAGHGHDLS